MQPPKQDKLVHATANLRDLPQLPARQWGQAQQCQRPQSGGTSTIAIPCSTTAGGHSCSVAQLLTGPHRPCQIRGQEGLPSWGTPPIQPQVGQPRSHPLCGFLHKPYSLHKTMLHAYICLTRHRSGPSHVHMHQGPSPSPTLLPQSPSRPDRRSVKHKEQERPHRLDYMSLMLLLLLLQYLPRCSSPSSRCTCSGCLSSASILPPEMPGAAAPQWHQATSLQWTMPSGKGSQPKAAGTVHHDAIGAPTPLWQRRAAPGQVQEPAQLHGRKCHVRRASEHSRSFS